MRKILQTAGLLALVATLWVNAYAATLSITIPDAIVPEVIAALEAEYGDKQAGESNAQFFRRTTRIHIKALIDKQRRRAAEAAAQPVPEADLGDS